MTTTSSRNKRDSKRGAYSYMDLMSEWELVNKDVSWMQFARCKGEDPALFFVERGDGWQAQHTEAKKICADCIVYKNCMKFALDNQITHGIWGGLSPTERRRFSGKGAEDE